jgi:hypothetical protein
MQITDGDFEVNIKVNHNLPRMPRYSEPISYKESITITQEEHEREDDEDDDVPSM